MNAELKIDSNKAKLNPAGMCCWFLSSTVRELTLGADATAAAEAADAAPPAASPVLLLVFDPELFVLSLLFLFPLLEEVVGGVAGGGKFLTRSIRLKRCLQQGHLFSVSAHYKRCRLDNKKRGKNH